MKWLLTSLLILLSINANSGILKKNIKILDLESDFFSREDRSVKFITINNKFEKHTFVCQVIDSQNTRIIHEESGFKSNLNISWNVCKDTFKQLKSGSTIEIRLDFESKSIDLIEI